MARPRQVSDQQILETAGAEFKARGSRASLDDVARKLGVTSPALLKRFGTRDALIHRALQPPTDVEFLAGLAAGPDANLPLGGQISELFNSTWGFLTEYVACLMALKNCGFDPSRDEMFRNGWHEIRAGLQGWIESAIARGLVRKTEGEAVATAIMGALQIRAVGAMLLRAEVQGLGDAAYLREVAELFTQALRRNADNDEIVSPPRARAQVKRGHV